VYDTEINGSITTFGTSGFLYQSNKLMYDRATDTLWHSMTGEPVIGALAGSDVQLTSLPVTVALWADWVEAHPETTVVSIDTGYRRQYLPPGEPGSAYNDYFSSPDRMFPALNEDDRLPPKTNVVGVEFGGLARAYLLDDLTVRPVLNDTVSSQAIVIVTDPEGGAPRVYERGLREFRVGEDKLEVVDQDGGRWSVTEDALVSESGDGELPRLKSRQLFWLGWSAFFPETEIFEG
jgi:hypothetical protein